MQLKLPLWTHSCYYECVNEHCFYCEHRMQYDTVLFRDHYNSRTGMLEMIPYCPSCQTEMIFWHEDTARDHATENPKVL